MKKFTGLILLFLFVAVCGAITYDNYNDRLEEEAKIAVYAPLLDHVNIHEGQTFDQKVDTIRLFLFETTEYSDGPEFKKIWNDHPAIAERINAYVSGEEETRAPLECSARSGVMERMLMHLGYNIRSVSIYKHAKQGYVSHTFLEVQHPETQKWQVQDVQYNLFWRMKEDGRRASIVDLVKYSFEDYEPCITEDLCGWDLPNREGNLAKKLKGHLGLASIIDRHRDERPLYVNMSRFNLDEARPVGDKKLTYCQYRRKNCREEIIRF